jgi:soluble lytic murein transglycosylase-like protein
MSATISAADCENAVFAAVQKLEPPTFAVLAQVRIESGFDVGAVSAAGAVGPCQILPATGADPGYGIEPISGAALLDPTLSTRFLCAYLTAMRGDRGACPEGDWATAFLRYNVGPGGDVRNASAAYKALARLVAVVCGTASPV